MRCYKCGEILSKNEFCTHCGADVEIYKKIVCMSNSFYNNGLEKAKQRDLSGAADHLRRSVKLDKNNIKARNLLGLVYYEMGEVVQAMVEWVISKNIKPEKNIADSYIKTLQSNPNKLDIINQTIKKYNIALEYAKKESDDLAVIQLKKVLNINPNLVKGHQLLALLYMKHNQYEKARKAIRKALRVDRRNTLSCKYLEEIEQALNASGSRLQEEKPAQEKEQLSGFDVIIPQNGYRESNHGTITVINVLIGIVLGIAATYFLITPAKVKSANENHNAEVKSLNSELDGANGKIDELERQIELLNGEKDDISTRLSNANSANDEVLKVYDKMILAARSYIKGEYRECAKALSGIKDQKNLSASFQEMYQELKNNSYKQAAVAAYNEATNLYYAAGNREQWQKAIQVLSEVFQYNYLETNYYDAADKLCNAYLSLYNVTVTEKPGELGKTKKSGIEGITKLIDRLSEVEGINEYQLDVYRNYLADLTARQP